MSNAESRRYHFGLALASFEGLFDSLDEAVAASWIQDAFALRYGRHWRISKVLASTDDYYFGRIGFVAPDEIETVDYDHDEHDWVHGSAPSGSIVPFVIRRRDGLVIYQLFPGVVRPTSFMGALEAVLNGTRSAFVWKVRPLTVPSTFTEWRSRVARVTAFDLRLERPNPNYLDRPFVEEFIEGTRAESVRLEATALEHGELDLTSDIFTQAMDHAARNYGRAKVTGVQDDGTESVWRKPKDGLPQVEQQITVVATGDFEAGVEILETVLAAREVVGARVHDGLGDEDEEE